MQIPLDAVKQPESNIVGENAEIPAFFPIQLPSTPTIAINPFSIQTDTQCCVVSPENLPIPTLPPRSGIVPIAQFKSIPSSRRTRLQTSNGMFDPNSSSPANEFMQTLKQRMDVYYC